MMLERTADSLAPAAASRSAAIDPTAASEAADSRRMTREERVRRCGVDCPDSIVWRHWGVGGEYLRKLVLKNTHDKLQVIQYKLPRQKATFFVDFPEPVTLSSGMAYELVVRFRPTAMVQHQDSIEIEVKGRGSFLIDLVALTPYARLDVPPKHDFQLCPVNAVSRASLAITNSGTVPLEFEWHAPAPFSIEPAAAALKEGEHMGINVAFIPAEATAVVAQAVCKASGTGETLAIVKLSGIGKYSFVRPTSDPQVDFGAVLTATSVKKTIIVENKSAVDASFQLTRTDKDIVNPFHVSPMQGVIRRDGSQKFTIKYTPESTSAHYTNDFKLSVVGGNEVAFRFTGTAVGPQVTLSVRTLDFGDVDLDKTSEESHEKIIVLKNKSENPVFYQFVGVDPGSAFVITPFNGVLGPRKLQNIRVRFSPAAPLNFLRRVHVLVDHNDKALFLDLLGTAYNSKARPAPFSHRHVRYYLARVAGGLARTTPDDIEKLVAKIKDNTPPEDEQEDQLRRALVTAMHAADVALASKTEPLDTVLPAEERLQLPFSLEESRVLFRSAAEAPSVTVRNHTSAKATAVWAVPEGCPWSIEPATSDIPAFSGVSFKVKLSPGAPATCFGHYVECYCFYKSMRSFRLVSEQTFTPSQCLQLLCQRVTPLTETAATPQITLPSHVAFPACHSSSCVYQVLPFKNDGDTVVAYDVAIEAHEWKGRQRAPGAAIFEQDEMEDDALEEGLLRTVFTCFPTNGVIQPNGTALLLFKFAPHKTQRFYGCAHITFNESSIGNRQIMLRGEGFVPQLQLSNNNMLTFRPTSVGGEMTREYGIENPSRIPVAFTVEVPEHLSSIIAMEPAAGTLQGCEKMALKATFTPRAAQTYQMKIPMKVRALHPPADAPPTISRQVCHALGDGVIGVLAVEPLEVAFGTALVGADAQRTITIFNSSLCDVLYRLDYLVRGGDSDGAPPLAFTPSTSGLLRARSHVNVEVGVKLPYRGTFSYTAYVVSGGSDAVVDSAKPTAADVERLPHCNITVTGEHPTLEITDVRSVYQRKSHLWRQLSVTKINEVLKAPVVEQDTETHSFTFDGATRGIQPITCDLGVDVFRTAPIRVLLRLDNVSHCPVSFHFWFPHESEVPKEPWHQEEQADDAQVAEIIDRRLFDVTPREATIPPGGHEVVLFTYQHTKIGQHTLPVLLRLEKGKRILLHLTARTLHEATKFLAFHHTLKHELLPVAIGDQEPPLQYSELQNLSHQPATYHIDQGTLQELRERNYDFPIFQCLNPSGTIPPMSTLLLSWYFRPLEAKRYEVSVKIHVEGGETYVLSLGATGYHPKKVTKQQIIEMHDKDVFPLPKYPTLKHPLLPLRLSMDVLRFGTIPFHSLHRQVITLENCHSRDTFLFEWHCVLQFGDQLLDVDPPRGRIRPGESRQFRVTMYSGSTSHIIDNPIHCHVLNEDLRTRRLAKRAASANEAAMLLDQPVQNNDMTSGTDASLTQAAKAARAQRGPRMRQPVTTIPAKYQSTGRLRQAIQQLTEAAVAEELDDDDDELTYVDVLPTVLEVLVQARIMPIDAYAGIYGDAKAKGHYYPTLRVYSSSGPVEPASNVTPTERAVALEVLDELLRQVVQADGIREAYTDPSEDPVPYFCEMASVSSSSGVEVAGSTGAESASPDSDRSHGNDTAAVPGALQCLIEEVLESAIYGITSESREPDGVLTTVADQLSKAAKLSKQRSGRAGGPVKGVNFNETGAAARLTARSSIQ